MKKTIILFSILFSCFLNAQTRHDVKLQLSGIPFSNYGIGYEAILNESISINTNLNLTTSQDVLGYTFDYNDFSFSPELRYYKDPDYDGDGFFYGMYFRYKKLSVENTSNSIYIGDTDKEHTSADHKIKHSIIGFSYGYKHVTDYGLFFESTLGLGYSLSRNINFKTEEAQEFWNENQTSFALEDDFEFYHTGLDKLDVRLSVSIGWRFNMND